MKKLEKMITIAKQHRYQNQTTITTHLTKKSIQQTISPPTPPQIKKTKKQETDITLHSSHPPKQYQSKISSSRTTIQLNTQNQSADETVIRNTDFIYSLIMGKAQTHKN